MYEFFVSYSRHDADLARAVAESLARLGVPAWMAEAEILIEGRKRLEDRTLLQAILSEASAASRRCLLLLSPHALASEWVMQTEVPAFLQRETAAGQVVWPIVVGADGDDVLARWPAGVQRLDPPRCRTIDEVDAVVRELCGKAGLTIPPPAATIALHSAETVTGRQTVTTEHRRIVFTLEIGTEWERRPPRSAGMLLNLRNSETGLVLNLIVGAMPRRAARAAGTQSVEEANYFAEPFVMRRMDLLSQLKGPVPAKAKGVFELLKLKLLTSVAGRPDVLGSHVVNVLGQPHFAYTYRLRPPIGPTFIARKYSIILTPPGADRAFEFVFTAGYPGSYEEFVKRIPRAESIVRTFRFAG